MKCKNCKWFIPANHIFDTRKNYNTCDNPNFVYVGSSPVPDHGLGYWDYESYSAGFYVGEEFGCIHWRAKE
jgi:hypothetical protein